MCKDMVSIIVPIYNVKPYLRKCLDSIIGQTYKEIEIVCIDDGSTDGSGDLLEDYAKMDNRFKIIHKKNGGLVSARKEGVRIANGKYACHIDSDDWIERDMIERLVQFAKSENADIVTSGLIRDYGNDKLVYEKDCFCEGIYSRERIDQEIKNKLLYTGSFFETGINMHLTNKLFKTGLLKILYSNMNDTIRMGEDAAIVAPYIERTKNLVITHEFYYHYVLRSDSCMGTKMKEDMDSIRALFIHFQNNLGKEMYYQISFFLMYHLLIMSPDKVFRYYYKIGNEIPFLKINKKETYILYGAGKFGVSLHEYLKDKIRICIWIDQIADNELVKPLEDVDFDNVALYDRIIIAALNYSTIQNMIESLQNRGVERNKMVTVTFQDDITTDVENMLMEKG